jgi:two-component system, NarL family, nitrate/nitrite response regulator NarL
MDGTPTIRIMIVDEQLLFREGLTRVLEGEPGFAVVGHASEPAEAARTAHACSPDVLIVGLSGRALIRMMHLLRNRPANGHRVHTIVLTAASEASRLANVLQLGAAGIVLRESSSQQVLKSIRRAVNGHDRRVDEGSTAPRRDRTPALASLEDSPFGLTRRELDIVGAVARGESNRKIAARFSIAEITVKHHLTRIFDKTAVASRLELAVFAINNELT